MYLLVLCVVLEIERLMSFNNISSRVRQKMEKRYEPLRLEGPRWGEFRLAIGKDEDLPADEVGHNSVYWLVGNFQPPETDFVGLYLHAWWKHGFNPIGIPAIQAVLMEGECLVYAPHLPRYADIGTLAQYARVAITRAGIYASASYHASPSHEISVTKTLIKKAMLVSPRRMQAIICGPWWQRRERWMHQQTFKTACVLL